jgi:hypothetical protein
MVCVSIESELVWREETSLFRKKGRKSGGRGLEGGMVSGYEVGHGRCEGGGGGAFV